MNWAKPLVVALLSIFLIQCSFLQNMLGEGSSKTQASTTASPAKSEPKAVDKVAVRDARKVLEAREKKNTSSAKKLPGVVDLAKGKVIFLRSSFVASAVDAKIYDVTAGSPKFIAEAKNNTQVHHRLDVGNYTFMLASESSVDYLNVHVAPNLSYYAIVKPSMGAWKPSFAFVPVKARDDNEAISQEQAFFGDENVETMLSVMTEVIETEDRLRAPRGDGKTDLMAVHLEHWAAWKSESPERHALKTLNSLDGV